ncbi:N-acetyltransferase [Kitasatospora sp. NA04385]|uniref:GNAT family N-acetyltransferase n=1 Tax=Kitasatospora sp. NA04385 TaxID=2742135 RepID=UPI00159173DF|nr:GNAT family N-acetyltransferase [Kitasatospora sp. NA04385]QKW18284.1 N-acetyltransferase [Kitasatospora sp. NA04385]
MSLSIEEVAAAGAAWVWMPEDAEVVADGLCTILRLPAYYPFRLSVVAFAPGEPLAGSVDAVLARARGLGLPVLDWQVLIGDPAGLEGELVARGGRLKIDLEILAADLSGGAPVLRPPVVATELRWAVDGATARDGAAVEVTGFGGGLPPAARIEETAARGAREVPAGRGGRLVAYLDGEPAGVGGVRVVDGVARLTGGVVVPARRGCGVYRALLAARLEYAVAHGARMALVKGNPRTSGPILRRAGFTGYGREPVYVLPLG